MKLPLRIAILECDTPMEKTKAKFGRYGRVHQQMLERAADQLGHPGLSAKEGLDVTMYNVELEEVYPELDAIDAIHITGSRHSAYDDTPWIIKLVDYVKQVLAQDRVRIIGMCFGHQIVGRALGQRVYKGDTGWEVSVTPIDLSEKGKELFKVSKLSLFQMHKDLVDGYPQSTEPLGETMRCPNQVMYIKNRLITVQAHPEFTKEIVEEILETRHKQGIFTDEVFEDAMKRLPDHDDGITVAQAFLRFLLED